MRQHLHKDRYRFRKSDGSPDLAAVLTFRNAVRHAPDLTPTQKSTLAGVQSRLMKSCEGALPSICVSGIWVFLDRPKGTFQEGISPDGTSWTREFICNYGFFPDTVGADNEPVDVFVGDHFDSDRAWVVRQLKRDGSFDEYKVLIGFKDEAQAMRMYFAHVPVWCFGGATELPLSFLTQLLACPSEFVATAMLKAAYYPLSKSVSVQVGIQACSPLQSSHPTALCYAALPSRLRKALSSVPTSYAGAVKKIEPGTEMSQHLAITAPITWDYNYPNQIGGWIGGIEPEDASWIAFVDATGHVLLWTQRDGSGGVIGTPYAFERPDLVSPPPRPVVVTDVTTPIPSEHLVQKETTAVANVPVQLPEVDRKTPFQSASPTVADLTPPAAVRENFRRALELHEEGHSGDGLQADTLAWARRLSRGEEISQDKVTTGVAWFARHESDRSADWATEKTPGYVAWMAWGGDEGRAWMMRLKRQFESQSRVQKSLADLAAESHCVHLGKSIERNDENRLIFGVVLEPEPFDGGGDAHGHTYSGDEVRRAAYEYLAYYGNLTDNHNHTTACKENPQYPVGVCVCGAYLEHRKAVVVESYCAVDDMVVNGHTIKKDSWLLRVHVIDDELWAKVLNGEWNAFSIEGIGDLIPLWSDG